MASNVDICNLALSHCGISSFIASMGEASNEARVCSLHLPFVRDAALRDFPWNFTRRRQTLAVLAGAPPTNWGYVYSLPADCLLAQRVEQAGARTPRADQRIPFEVANSGTQGVLYTDQADAELIYTAKIENPALFDPLFVQALSWGLAAEIAAPLAAAPGMAKAAQDRYLVALSQAAAACLREGSEQVPESLLVEGRF